MTWVVDKGLDKLLAQINAAAPNRSKASDGSIGDEAHQGSDSDHNPEDDGSGGNPEDQVDARDFTHDPAHGADMAVVSESIRKSKDNRVSYVIFNRRIYSGALGPSPWAWRSYSGDNPHDHHMHVSVRDDTHDQTHDWKIGIGDDMPTGLIGLAKGDESTEVRGLQNLLRRAGYDPGESGTYDSKTAAAVLKMRQDMGSSATSGDTVNGDAYAQLIAAVSIAYAKQYAGEKGDPGPAGPPGAQGPPGPATGQQFTVQAL